MKLLFTLFISLLLSFGVTAQKVEWASKVINFSSEVNPLFFSALQITGKPNVSPYGDENPNAWTPYKPNKIDYVKVGFARAFRIRQIAIVESYNPGALYRIYAYDKNDEEYLVASFEPKPVPFRVV